VSLRTERIGEQLRGEIARVLRQEVTDPRLGMVTLTRVDVAPDLSHALVFWSHLDLKGDHPVEEVEAGLESAAGFVRTALARALPLRRVPALRFRRDPSLELGGRTLSLLSDLDVHDDPGPRDDPDTRDADTGRGERGHDGEG
jgi:ribosome-binding factor A